TAGGGRAHSRSVSRSQRNKAVRLHSRTERPRLRLDRSVLPHRHALFIQQALQFSLRPADAMPKEKARTKVGKKSLIQNAAPKMLITSLRGGRESLYEARRRGRVFQRSRPQKGSPWSAASPREPVLFSSRPPRRWSHIHR